MTVATWRWWDCQPYAPAAFTPQEIFLVLISVRGSVDSRTTVMPSRTQRSALLYFPSHGTGLNLHVSFLPASDKSLSCLQEKLSAASVLPIDNSDFLSYFCVSLMSKNGTSAGSCPATSSKRAEEQWIGLLGRGQWCKELCSKRGKKSSWFPALY